VTRAPTDLGATLTFRPARADELGLILALDEDATLLYLQAGLDVSLPRSHPYGQYEERRWAADAAAGRVTFAVLDGEVAGFTACHFVDGAPYLDQLSVWRRLGGRGIGRALLDRVLAWAAPLGPLWLTTYDHPGVPWNRPMYERRGFTVVPEAAWGPEMRAVIAGQREALPAPEARVVMCRSGA
jgi:GNAT superfamily N-acetyltransferase